MKKSRCFSAALVILSMVVFVWSFPVLEAEGIELGAGDGPEGYRPGKTNPVSNPARWCLLAEDMLAVSSSYGVNNIPRGWNVPTSDYLTDWQAFATYGGWNVPQYNFGGPTAVAKGRVLSILKDDAVIVFYINEDDAAKPVLAFLNVPFWNYVIPGTYYAGIPSGTFSTIDVAVGDIDGEVNKSGERLDEIVIAYRKKNPGSGYSVWITALKANGVDSFTVLDSVQTGDESVYSGYGFMAVTTGDYDNDG